MASIKVKVRTDMLAKMMPPTAWSRGLAAAGSAAGSVDRAGGVEAVGLSKACSQRKDRRKKIAGNRRPET
jgi:hypothetical protein